MREKSKASLKGNLQYLEDKTEAKILTPKITQLRIMLNLVKKSSKVEGEILEKSALKAQVMTKTGIKTFSIRHSILSTSVDVKRAPSEIAKPKI